MGNNSALSSQSKAVVTILLIALYAVLIVLPIASVNAQGAHASTLPAKSFIILLDGQEQLNLTSAYPFAIAIFSWDANGVQTTNFNGALSLSVTEGSIIPTTVTASNGHWTGYVTVNATDSVVITAEDNEGHSGSSNTLAIHQPNPTQLPTSTPNVSELSSLALAPLLLSIFSVAVIVKYRKTNNLNR